MIELFKQMRNITNEFTPPLVACGSYRVTYARLNDLEKVILDYIHLESNILFSRIKTGCKKTVSMYDVDITIYNVSRIWNKTI